MTGDHNLRKRYKFLTGIDLRLSFMPFGTVTYFPISPDSPVVPSFRPSAIPGRSSSALAIRRKLTSQPSLGEGPLIRHRSIGYAQSVGNFRNR